VKKIIASASLALFVFGIFLGGTPAMAQDNKVVIQVSDDNPRTMNIALNNAKNLTQALGAGNVDIEIVVYGPGLNMVAKDSKLAAKIKGLHAFGNVKFAVCGNTMKSRKWTKDNLLKDAFIQDSIVPGGVIRIMELQKQGYAYIRP